MTWLPWAGADPETNKRVIAVILIIITFIMVSTPKFKQTCSVLYSFTCAFWREFGLFFVAWLKEVRAKLRTSVKKLIYTESREWLDEAEMRITE